MRNCLQLPHCNIEGRLLSLPSMLQCGSCKFTANYYLPIKISFMHKHIFATEKLFELYLIVFVSNFFHCQKNLEPYVEQKCMYNN